MHTEENGTTTKLTLKPRLLHCSKRTAYVHSADSALGASKAAVNTMKTINTDRRLQGTAAQCIRRETYTSWLFFRNKPRGTHLPKYPSPQLPKLPYKALYKGSRANVTQAIQYISMTKGFNGNAAQDLENIHVA